MARTTRELINGQNGADRPFHRHFLGAASGMIGEIFVGDSGGLFAEKKTAARNPLCCRLQTPMGPPLDDRCPSAAIRAGVGPAHSFPLQ